MGSNGAVQRTSLHLRPVRLDHPLFRPVWCRIKTWHTSLKLKCFLCVCVFVFCIPNMRKLTVTAVVTYYIMESSISSGNHNAFSKYSMFLLLDFLLPLHLCTAGICTQIGTAPVCKTGTFRWPAVVSLLRLGALLGNFSKSAESIAQEVW